MGGREGMNVLHPNKKAAIITLLSNGVSQREIERKIRVDRKTIRKYGRMSADGETSGGVSKSPGVATGSEFDTDQNPPPRPPGTPPIPAHARSACEEHRPWIEATIYDLINTPACGRDGRPYGRRGPFLQLSASTNRDILMDGTC